ncbi:hypothetical protein GCM10010967_31220 [Dyadobacter beijingensis]|uniref:DUF3592 domain-containing protein n=1 Tax=Dyadobacter beijingensis TaxID=365489 RepID=A0ABQ2I195_9BACT|nr:hypothetical protein [Dyadobacter beijingensis]GGM95550.1 hypothetical protein GCM10010967_31220 [Dyadobacter beijingensis]
MEILALHSKQILLILSLVLLIAGGLWIAFRMRRTLLLLGGGNVPDGQTAEAVVLLSEEHPASYLQGDAYYTFQVHVKPVRGRNFVTEVHVLREQLKRIPQAGDRVSVKYNYSGRRRNVVLNLDSLPSV